MLDTQYEELVGNVRSRWVSGGYPLRTAVRRWLKFFDARGAQGLTDMFEEHKERFLAGDTLVECRFFVFENLVREIVKKRAEAIPTDMTVEASDAALDTWAKEVLALPAFGDGRSFHQQQEAWNVYCEKTGNLVLVLAPITEPEALAKFKITRMPTEDMDIRYNADDITQVYEYLFRWEVQYLDDKGDSKIAKIEFSVDRERYKYTINDEVVQEIPHPYTFIPVVHVVNEEVDNSLIGESVIESLIEPQLQVNAIASDIRMAHRLGVYPVYYGTIDPDDFLFGPGSFTHCEASDAMNRLETTTDTAQLTEELQRTKKSLFQLGRVSIRDEGDIRAMGNTPSGKALMVLNQDGIQYVEGRIAILERAWAELLGKLAVVCQQIAPERLATEGHTLFKVTYASMVIEDPAQQTAEFDRAVTLNAGGLLSDSDLLELGKIKGVIPGDWDVKEILTKARAEKAARDMERATMIAAATERMRVAGTAAEEETAETGPEEEQVIEEEARSSA